MLVLGKRIDYALISLAFLAARPQDWVCAREIAEANGVPGSIVMQILKSLHHHGVVQSTRGSKGGYRIATDLDRVSLAQLSAMLDGAETRPADTRPPTDLPGQRVREHLSRFLENVRVSEVITPGHSIDVPIEALRKPVAVTV